MKGANEIAIDVVSLLVSVPASTTLDTLETALAAGGFTLGIDLDKVGPKTVIGEWLAIGAPGASSLFADPSDHLVAGLDAILASGRTLEVRPGPRRAVGPDLTALVMGTRGKLARLERVWLRIHRRDARRPAMSLPEGVDLDPPLTEAEAKLVDALARELARDV